MYIVARGGAFERPHIYRTSTHVHVLCHHFKGTFTIQWPRGTSSNADGEISILTTWRQ